MTTTRSLMNRRMGTAALIVSGGVLISRVLGLLRELAFAWVLGADGITDQYVAAFRIPDFLNYLLAGGFLSITFIPIFSRYLAEDDEEEGWRAFSAVFRPLAIGIVAFVVVAWMVAPAIIEAIYPEFTADQIIATTRLTRIVLPAQIFFVLGALFAAVQYAKGEFLVPSIAPIVYNLGILIGGLAYAGIADPDPEGFIWGALVGAFVGNFAVQWWGARRVGMHLAWAGSWRHPAIREYVLIALPLMLGQSIVVLDETFMSVFGDLVGDGAQTQLLYARRTMFMPVGVIAQAAGVAAYPYLARMFAEGNVATMAATVNRALKYVIVLSMAAAGILTALSWHAIRILFQHGSFDAADTGPAAAALFFYALSIPIWGALQILTRAFYATRDMWTPVVVGTVATIAALPAYWGLQRAFGIEGVALASVLALTFYTAALAFLWYRVPERRAGFGPVVETTARTVPLAVGGALAAWAASWAIGVAFGQGFAGAVVGAAIGVVVFSVVAVGSAAGLYVALTRNDTRTDGDAAKKPDPTASR